ncbi:coiled-coil domain-containing protein 190 isoform X1 [Esox lucius]|uniref:coiled-coil domain-containing protein 190 isoform X1 n=2 Tax=Esox lucius TaxID=8010 RepID=UPI001476C960|nr:coiled-coil domain-containing protein 190 isoform X1 [Esox lucius]
MVTEVDTVLVDHTTQTEDYTALREDHTTFRFYSAMHGGSSRGLWQATEALRREERRAQARLQGGLQRLELATSYHLNTLTTEQLRLHRDLFNIRSGNSWKRSLHPLVVRKLNPDPSHPSMHYRTTLPTIPRTIKEPQKQRSVKSLYGVLSGPAALQARVHDFLGSSDSADTQIHGAGSSMAPLCLPDLKLQPAAALTITGLEGRGESQDVRGRETRSMRLKDREEENGSPDGDRECCPDLPPPSSAPSPCPLPPAASDSLALAGQPRTLHLLPDFGQSLAEARKARYIRYRGRPPCERELSITEIFARGNTSSTHRF